MLILEFEVNQFGWLRKVVEGGFGWNKRELNWTHNLRLLRDVGIDCWRLRFRSECKSEFLRLEIESSPGGALTVFVILNLLFNREFYSFPDLERILWRLAGGSASFTRVETRRFKRLLLILD